MNATDPPLFLGVLHSADLTGEEMFCLIPKREEIRGQSAKSHYSPACSAALHEASPRREKKPRDRETREKKFILPPDRTND